MKTKAFLFSVVMFIGLTGLVGCKKQGCIDVNSCNYDPNAKKDDGTCINKGQITFWQDSSTSGYDIVVTINATEASVTTQLGSVPACDASGCANFSMCPGSHNWVANERFPGTKSWTGNVVSVQDGCTAVLLN